MEVDIFLMILLFGVLGLLALTIFLLATYFLAHLVVFICRKIYKTFKERKGEEE